MERCSYRTSGKKSPGETQAREPTDQLCRGRKGQVQIPGEEEGRQELGLHTMHTLVVGDGLVSRIWPRKTAWVLDPGFATYSRQAAYPLPVRVKIMNEMASVGNISVLWSHDPDLGMAIKGVKAKVLL